MVCTMYSSETKCSSLFKDKAQALQSSCCSAGTENRSSSPVVEPFNPLTPPSSTKKPAVLMID